MSLFITILTVITAVVVLFFLLGFLFREIAHLFFKLHDHTLERSAIISGVLSFLALVHYVASDLRYAGYIVLGIQALVLAILPKYLYDLNAKKATLLFLVNVAGIIVLFAVLAGLIILVRLI